MYMYLYVKGPERDPKGLHLFHTFSYYFNLFQSYSTYFIECHTFSVMFILFHTISYYFQLPTTAGCHGTGSSTFPRFWWFFHGRSFLGSHQRGRPPFNFNTMGRQLKKVVTECGWDLHCSNRWMMKIEHMRPLIFSQHEKPKLHYIVLQYASICYKIKSKKYKNQREKLLHPHKHTQATSLPQ